MATLVRKLLQLSYQDRERFYVVIALCTLKSISSRANGPRGEEKHASYESFFANRRHS